MCKAQEGEDIQHQYGYHYKEQVLGGWFCRIRKIFIKIKNLVYPKQNFSNIISVKYKPSLFVCFCCRLNYTTKVKVCIFIFQKVVNW